MNATAVDRIHTLFGRFEKWLTHFITEVGRMVVFAASSLRLSVQPPFRYLEIIRQLEFVGNHNVVSETVMRRE